MLRGVGLLIVGALFVGCADDLDEPAQRSAAGLVGDVLVTGLEAPTQLAIGGDGFWYIAQLAGAENDGTGEIVRIDPTDPEGEPVAIVDGLDKPTGVAVFADELWIMERQRLTRGPLDGSSRTVVVDEMASNGRSEGSLTVDGDRLLFDTSGSLSSRGGLDGTPETASGVLWSVSATGDISAIASGFKHAYAQTRGADGQLWTTEMSDGAFDGQPAPDEVVVVTEGRDHGWPRCVGDNRVVVEHGGDAATCALPPRSHALFEVGATPTSIVVSPWDDELLLVALWNRGQVVAISTQDETLPTRALVVFEGIERPQDLTADGSRVLLVDFGGGQVLSLEPDS